jgi:hypothetical protein
LEGSVLSSRGGRNEHCRSSFLLYEHCCWPNRRLLHHDLLLSAAEKVLADRFSRRPFAQDVPHTGNRRCYMGNLWVFAAGHCYCDRKFSQSLHVAGNSLFQTPGTQSWLTTRAGELVLVTAMPADPYRMSADAGNARWKATLGAIFGCLRSRFRPNRPSAVNSPRKILRNCARRAIQGEKRPWQRFLN